MVRVEQLNVSLKLLYYEYRSFDKNLFLQGSDSDDSDVDLDLKLLQRLQRIEGREAEKDRERFKEEEERGKPVETKYTDVEEEPDTPPRDNRQKK